MLTHMLHAQPVPECVWTTPSDKNRGLEVESPSAIAQRQKLEACPLGMLHQGNSAVVYDQPMLPTSALDYDLPERLIATRPASPREDGRLMVLQRSDPARVEHCRIADLPGFVPAGTTAVFNRTRVLPARFLGINLDTGGRVEGLWLEDGPGDGLVWHALVRVRRHRPGRRMELVDAAGNRSGVVLTLIERVSADGVWALSVEDPQARVTPGILDAVGLTPLPPYIRGARKKAGVSVSDAEDRRDYQTVFAAEADEPGHWSVAAPTAGLHFTPEILEQLDARGIERAEVMLDVGPGTFKPIETDTIEAHQMHSEWCSLGDAASVLDAPGPVLAVGSTSARTLESFALARASGRGVEGWMSTDLMISPGYQWQRVDAMVTNFHLPRSTLLLMVGAFLPGGIEQLLDLYGQAVEMEYRFYSYGDAMLILP
jgi:S-adenosylmethionine:tRNA ribosyltransferase-isomerase